MTASKNKKENIHAAASEEDCERMGKNYGWKLIEVRDKVDQNKEGIINFGIYQERYPRKATGGQSPSALPSQFFC